MKFDDLCERLNINKDEDVSVNEHTEKVLDLLVKRGLISEDTCDLLNEQTLD